MLCLDAQVVAHDQAGGAAAPPSLSMSAHSGPAPSAAASVVAHGTTQPHPHQDCTSAVADGQPAEQSTLEPNSARGARVDGPEILGAHGVEPGFSSTAPLLTAAADAGHSCTAAPSGNACVLLPQLPVPSNLFMKSCTNYAWLSLESSGLLLVVSWSGQDLSFSRHRDPPHTER